METSERQESALEFNMLEHFLFDQMIPSDREML